MSGEPCVRPARNDETFHAVDFTRNENRLQAEEGEGQERMPAIHPFFFDLLLEHRVDAEPHFQLIELIAVLIA